MFSCRLSSSTRRTTAIPLPVVSAFAAMMLIGLGCTGSNDGPATADQSAVTAPPSPTAPTSPPPPTTPPVTPPAVVASQTLPILNITTDGAAPIDSKETYVPGNFRLTTETGTVLVEGGLEIRGRGNSTWDLPKKPYRVKLKTGAALLGMPSSKHWVLLANHTDKTLVRNQVAFDLSERLGMAYTPRSVQIEVILNGRYDGVYQLTEHIRIDPNRVNIPELKKGDTDADKITGGYLIEVDARRGEDYCRDSLHTGMVLCFKEPETLLEPGWEPHRAYIDDYLVQMENALYGNDFANPAGGYRTYLDVDSILNYYIIQELFKNVDGNLTYSAYLYKKRGDKIFFGPMWDFDLAIGNAAYNDADKTDGWHIRSAYWFARLFQDPAFDARLRARWAEFKAAGVFEGIFADIDRRTTHLDKAQVKNFQRWDILNVDVPPNRVVTGSYAAEVAAMKAWLRDRYNWMDAQLQ